MEEILCSLHNYTKLSGGVDSFYELAQHAIDCGIDAVFTTDKNIYAEGHTGYYYRSEKKLLLLCGEELFDPLSGPDQSYLSLGIEKEQFNRKIGDSQNEIRIRLNLQSEVKRSRHIELINSEDILQDGIYSGQKLIRKNLNYFDELLNSKQRYITVSGTCSSDHRKKFTYPELLSTAINHLLTENNLTGDLDTDKNDLLSCIRSGRLYIGLDGLADAKGFRFSAEGNNQDSTAYPGDTIYIKNSITFKITTPEACTCRLLKDGNVIREWEHCKQIPYTIYEPGVYRTECALTIRRNSFDWIFSNPIYVVKG